jgi:hypothetical protein
MSAHHYVTEEKRDDVLSESVATEAVESPLRTTNHTIAFWRLTPELSRPVAGRRTRASVAHSTWPTPRRGVGLNELLGVMPVRETVRALTSKSCPKKAATKGARWALDANMGLA